MDRDTEVMEKDSVINQLEFTKVIIPTPCAVSYSLVNNNSYEEGSTNATFTPDNVLQIM